jgi:hypothetical protein
VGGRLKSLHIGDHPFELGGSMVYEGNEYVRHAPAGHLAIGKRPLPQVCPELAITLRSVD